MQKPEHVAGGHGTEQQVFWIVQCRIATKQWIVGAMYLRFSRCLNAPGTIIATIALCTLASITRLFNQAVEVMLFGRHGVSISIV